MTTDPVQTVLDRLDGVKAQSDGQWIARCPAHADRKPSLSIKRGADRQALVYCHAKCALDDVLAAMNPPMTTADLFPRGTHPNGSAIRRNSERKIVETYDYVDTFGVLLYQVVRYEPKDFRLRRPDADGGWTWNIKGVERVLYRLQEVTRAPNHCMIYVVEGERDADTLHAEGMIATCNSGGAGNWKHADDTPLHGRHVAIIPDNEPSGHEHAQDVAKRLHGKAKSVRIVELPGLAVHGDVSDWLDAGNDPEDLDRLAATAPLWKLSTAIVKPEAETSLEPYRAGESMRAVNRMSATARQLRETGSTLAEQVAEWLDRRGPETLDGIDFPIPYAAAAIGVSRGHFHKLGQIGRVRRCRAPCDTPLALSDRAILPFARLLESRPEAIPEAIKAAGELAKAESKPYAKPKPVSKRHAAAAVDELIGPAPPHTPVRRKLSPDAVAAREFLSHLSKAIDIAASLSFPRDLDMLIKAVGKHPHIKSLGGLP